MSTTDLAGNFEELFINLSKVQAQVGVKALRAALRVSVRPVIKQMRASAPKGTKPHKTYLKNPVDPGYLRKSIKYLTKVDRQAGLVSAIIGVRPEAFYGIQFYDQGPYTIRTRRVSTNDRATRREHLRNISGGRTRTVKASLLRSKGRRTINIKPYTLKNRPWFETVFRSNRANMETSFANNVRVEMEKAITVTAG